MKKLILFAILPTIGIYASSTWTCYRYVDGSPTGGFVKVTADSKQEATQKAIEKYKKLGYRFDSVNCK